MYSPSLIVISRRFFSFNDEFGNFLFNDDFSNYDNLAFFLFNDNLGNGLRWVNNGRD